MRLARRGKEDPQSRKHGNRPFPIWTRLPWPKGGLSRGVHLGADIAPVFGCRSAAFSGAPRTPSGDHVLGTRCHLLPIGWADGAARADLSLSRPPYCLVVESPVLPLGQAHTACLHFRESLRRHESSAKLGDAPQSCSAACLSKTTQADRRPSYSV